MKLFPDAGPERRRALVLVVVLAAVVAWVWWPAETGPVALVAPGAVQGAEPQPGGAGASLESLRFPERVRLESLEREAEPVDVGRNLFRFGARPVPPPPPPIETAVMAPPPEPPRPTGPPPIALRLSGRFESPDGRVVVTLKDPATGALFHATEGEVVDGRYRLIKVGVQSVVVSYLDGSGQRTIALGG
jgi:hypothetical protein